MPPPVEVTLSSKELLERAEIIVIGKLIEARRLRHRSAGYVPYENRVQVRQWVRGSGDKSEVLIGTYRLENPAFRNEYEQLKETRMWFLLETDGQLRTVTDRGLSSLNLKGLPDEVRLATDGSSESVAAALLHPDLAKSWPSYPQHLPRFIELAGEFLAEPKLLAALQGLERRSEPDVSRIACEQMYILFDGCRAKARSYPYFHDLESRRRQQR